MGIIKSKIRRTYLSATRSLSRQLSSPTLSMMEFDRLRDDIIKKRPSDIAARGYKVYSQNDEDGIIEAIFEKIGSGSTYIEIGVENGRECNTHLLTLKGWSGVWIEGSDKMCAQIERDLGGRVFPGKFALFEEMVFAENMVELYDRAMAFLGGDNVDFFSLDIDGNDLFVLKALLDAGRRPSVLCVEYNGKFPPPIDITVPYSRSRMWQHNDHFGASLQAFCNLAGPFGYKLITCNVTGANAFFVVDSLAHLFEPVDPADVWRVLRLDISPLPAGHRTSLEFMGDVLAQRESAA